MSGPTRRTLALLSLLQTHRHWRGAELASRLGVSERTVRRDVERLRELGYPVDAETGPEGGYRLAVGTHVPPLVIDDDEAIALFVGLRSASVASIDGVGEATVALMAKLARIMPDRLRRRVDALQQSVEVMTWASDAPMVPVASLAVLSQGCRDREEVRFGYRSRDDQVTLRLVRPHQLVSAGRRWYLVGWDVRRDGWRTFRVDRMEGPALAGVRFEPQTLPAADAAAFLAEGIRALSSVHRARVLVDAPPGELAPIRRWLDAAPEPADGGRSLVELSAESTAWLASTIAILSVDHDLEVIDAPDEVRRHLAVAARRLAVAGEGFEGHR